MLLLSRLGSRDLRNDVDVLGRLACFRLSTGVLERLRAPQNLG